MQMEKANFEEALKRYIELSSRIRLLSAPEIGEIKDEEDYRDVLVENFTEIGEMADEIAGLLNEVIDPLLDGDELLSPEEVNALNDFSRVLVNSSTMSYLDPVLCHKIALRLLANAEKSQDDGLIVKALDKVVDSSYTMMNLAFRLRPCSDIGEEIRRTGLEASRRLLKYLDKDLFRALPDGESRDIVLINSRYINALEFAHGKMSDDERAEMLRNLDGALELEHDAFYSEMCPDYDWNRHRFRTYQYYISCTEMNNICGFTKDEMELIYSKLLKLEDMWYFDKEFGMSMCSESTVELYRARVTYLSGSMEADEYKRELRRLHDSADKQDYGLHGIISNVFLLKEYLLVIRETGMNDEDSACLAEYYRRLIDYLQRMPKTGSIIYATTMMSDIIRYYVDIPNFNFTMFCLRLIVAIHPPTYVHTLTMSSIVANLTTHLVHKRPELFMQFLKCGSAEEVLQRKEEIVSFATKSALTHDIGKLFVIEFIMLYGRRLYDEEFMMIRKHPDIGSHVMCQHEKAKKYRALALAHHFRFDELEEKAAEGMFDASEIPFIGVATVADALDAATDTVGRSYKKGKPLETVIEELRDGQGRFYAPFVVELFDDPEVVSDVDRILSAGREDNYRKAFKTLSYLNTQSESI